jgi:hypothetical protein
MQPMEQYISESHSESESDPKEEDRKELVSKRSCISDELVSKQAQKKQKVSVTDLKSEEAMKLVNEMYFHHVQTMFPKDYSYHFIFTCI